MTAPYMRPAAGTRLPTPPGMTPCSKLCLRCGRVTARRDGDGWPWCGGELPTIQIGATA